MPQPVLSTILAWVSQFQHLVRRILWDPTQDPEAVERRVRAWVAREDPNARIVVAFQCQSTGDCCSMFHLQKMKGPRAVLDPDTMNNLQRSAEDSFVYRWGYHWPSIGDRPPRDIETCTAKETQRNGSLEAKVRAAWRILGERGFQPKVVGIHDGRPVIYAVAPAGAK